MKSIIFISLLVVSMFTVSPAVAQNKNETTKTGTKKHEYIINGECVMKDGKKMKMKEGQCMDMAGKMDKCSMMNKSMKNSTTKKM